MNRNHGPAFDRDFDARLRGTWREAVDAVPPALAWRLRPVAPESRAQHRPARWPMGAALATAAVIALAIGLRPHASRMPDTAPAPAIAASSADAAPTAPLDRSPDFYAWLASPDAEQLAME